MSYNTRTLGKRIAALSLVIGLLAGTFLPSPGVLYAETPDSSSVVDAGEPLLIGVDGAVSDATDVLSSVTSALSESTSSAAQSAVSSDSTESVSSESVSASSVSQPASDSASVPESNAEDSSMSEGSEPADSDSAADAASSESASAVQSESVSAADSASTENDTVDEADEPFNALAVLDPKPGHDIKAKVGDEITLTSGVNRDDVVVSYQWQRMQLSMPKEEAVQEEIVPLFDYDEASPTLYALHGTRRQSLLLHRCFILWLVLSYQFHAEKSNFVAFPTYFAPFFCTLAAVAQKAKPLHILALFPYVYAAV